MSKLVTNKVSFLSALQIASKAIGSNPIIPLYNNIRLDVNGEDVKMTSTDFELSIQVNISNAKGDKFITAVPAKLTTDFVNTLQDEKLSIKFDSNKQTIFVKTSHSTNTIKCINADDYPELPPIKKFLLKVSAGELKKAIVRTSFCASSDENKPALTGIHLVVQASKLTLATVDGFHLATQEIKAKRYGKSKTMVDAIIKASTLNIVSRILDDDGDVSIDIRETNVVFNSENVCVSVQKIDGNFPDVDTMKKSVSKSDTVTTIPTLQLLGACKQVHLFTGEKNQSTLTITKDSIELSAISSEKGESKFKVDGTVKGKGISIGINILMLKQFLEVCDTEEVSIEFTEPNRPMLFKMQNDETYNHIIMPIMPS